MQKQVKGILFDLGETLLDFGQVDVNALFEDGARAAYEYLQQQGKSLPPFSAYHRRQLWAIRWNYLKSQITGREFNTLDLMGKMAGRLGHELTEAEAMELAWLLYEPLGDQATVEVGLADMLAGLTSQGLALGLVSNTFIPGEVLDRHLKREGLLGLLPIRVYSSDTGYRKPNRRIFATALEQLALPADAVMFVGDSLVADIKGANKKGMISVLKDPTGKHDRAGIRPAYRVRSLAELPGVIAKCNGA